MPDTNKNLGAQVQVSVYVEGKKVGRDFVDVGAFNDEDQFYAGNDEYLGPGDVRPWQRYKNTTGGFNIDQSNALFTEQLRAAIRTATVNGQQPKIVLAKRTLNGDGTVTNQTWSKVAMSAKVDAPGKGEKIKYDWTWTGIANKPE